MAKERFLARRSHDFYSADENIQYFLGLSSIVAEYIKLPSGTILGNKSDIS